MEANVLVISNEAFSTSGSNGRTMRNLLLDVPKQNLAQFYLHGTPDTECCENYFKVSDQDALRAFLGKKPLPASEKAESHDKQDDGEKKPSKSYRNLALRNIIWQSRRWWKQDFDRFLNDFCPNIVLLQAGDAPFLLALARKIAKKYGAKLMLYTSEGYVLKKRMYASVKWNAFWHFVLMRSLKKQHKKFMKRADFCIYSTESLEEAYQAKYPHKGKSTVFYTVSEQEPLPDRSAQPFRLLYCGNLGVGRDKPLAEIAKVLHELDETAVLDIYGKFKDQETQDAVCANPSVHFHGFVSYDQIPVLMSEASMLVHCENEERLENLRHAFSTKIADSLAVARPFLVYASRKYPFVQYLEKHDCAHIAADADELKAVLQRCMADSGYLNQHTEAAKTVAKTNHSKAETAKAMSRLLKRMCGEEQGDSL